MAYRGDGGCGDPAGRRMPDDRVSSGALDDFAGVSGDIGSFGNRKSAETVRGRLRKEIFQSLGRVFDCLRLHWPVRAV